MNNTKNALKKLLIEIPEINNTISHEKLKSILMSYTRILLDMLITYKVIDYFKNLHKMSFDTKLILTKPMSADTELETFKRTRDTLIKDINSLIEMTEDKSIVKN